MSRGGSRHSHWRVPKGGYPQRRSPTFVGVPPVASSSFDFVNARFVQWFLNHQFISALAKAGKMAVPGERFVGTPLLLRPSLQSLGCQDIHETAHLVNFFAGTEEYVFVGDDIIRGMETMNAFVLKSRIVEKKKLAEAQEQVRRDLQSPDFPGLMFFV